MAPPSARTRHLLRPAALSPSVRTWAGPAVVSLALSLVAIGAATARGQSPIEVEPWLANESGRLVRHGTSLALGIVLALATIAATRLFVRRWRWARDLHADLRASVSHASASTIVVLGISSAASEELFFRGLLATTFGLVASSLAFGLLHQMQGRVRWVWAGWATVMGFLFGAVFFATGSLLGALVAHATINVANLRFLRDVNVAEPERRRFGDLRGHL